MEIAGGVGGPPAAVVKVILEVPAQLSSLSYILPSYLYSKPPICNSYSNCRGVGYSSHLGTAVPSSGSYLCLQLSNFWLSTLL